MSIKFLPSFCLPSAHKNPYNAPTSPEHRHKCPAFPSAVDGIFLTNHEEKNMPFYETVFIARQDLSDAQVKEITETCEKIIKDGQGKIVKTENWGLRTLAYRIQKNRKGHYVLIETDSPAPAVLEMERTLRLNENILRYMTIKLDELSKGPSKIIDRNTSEDDSTGKEAA
jgi:small subunit ribosomal protein S6